VRSNGPKTLPPNRGQGTLKTFSSGKGAATRSAGGWRVRMERIHPVEELLVRGHGARLGPRAHFLNVFRPGHAERLGTMNFREQNVG
jgi:hypothetical protein